MPHSSWSRGPAAGDRVGVPPALRAHRAPPSAPAPSARPAGDLLDAFAPRAGQAMVFLLVFGLVGGWFLAGRMLAPLTRITDATRYAGTGSLSHRIRLEGRSDEFRELADAFDTMLARLEARVAEQQRFAANASHELRTPLAVTQTLLDVARKDPDVDHRELVDRLRVRQRPGDRPHRGPAGPQPRRPAVLHPGARRPVAPRRGRRRDAPVRWRSSAASRSRRSGDATPTVGSPALLQQMTTNLVHNAIVHNLAEGGRVWVTTSAPPTGAVLTVENTGGHLSPALVATLVEPFQRGTGRTRSDHAGVGLGLAIVDSIVRAHDGALTLTSRPDGGLVVTVALPSTADEAGCEPWTPVRPPGCPGPWRWRTAPARSGCAAAACRGCSGRGSARCGAR